VAGAIIFALRQADTGVPLAEVCRIMGVSEATYYNWNRDDGPQEVRRSGCSGASEASAVGRVKTKVKTARSRVARHRRLSLDKQMLQDVLKKSSKADPETDAGRQLNEELSGCRHAIGIPALFFFVLSYENLKILLFHKCIGRCRTINRIVVTIMLFVELRKLPRCEFVMGIKEFMFCLDGKVGGTKG